MPDMQRHRLAAGRERIVTLDEFGEWLEVRARDSARSHDGSMCWSEHERDYGRTIEAEDVLRQWKKVKRDGSESQE